jgi:hypothetical protein
MLGHHRSEPSSANVGAGSSSPHVSPDRLVGRLVVDQHDAIAVGEVDAVFVDQITGDPRYLRLSTGGILGVGKTHGLVPTAAVVRIEESRILIDPRLTLQAAQQERRQRRWDIPPRTSVLAADDREIGMVLEVHPGFVVAEHGVAFTDDVYIPNDAIALYCGQYVRLVQTMEAALSQGWDIAPPHLVRAPRVD